MSSRSAADATRFTATGPYANSKPGAASASANPASATPYKLPSSLSSKFQGATSTAGASSGAGRGNVFGAGATAAAGAAAGGGGGGGNEETPRQKVDRLRAQARAARIAQSTSRIDRMIDIGRRYANRAHKVMVYSLITASGICGALTIYSVFSLTLYNRRQRLLWLDRELEKLQNARLAYAHGTATPEQVELLRNEKIGDILKEQKEQEKEQRPWNRAKRFLFGGLKSDQNEGEGESGRDAGGESGRGSVGEGVGGEVLTSSSPAGDAVGNSPVLSAVSESKSASANANQQGQLDSMAENAETAAKQSARSWKSWFFGR